MNLIHWAWQFRPRFTFKVVVETDEALHKILECYGEPKARKKDAAEHAAEGALWYLKHKGYLWEKKWDWILSIHWETNCISHAHITNVALFFCDNVHFVSMISIRYMCVIIYIWTPTIPNRNSMQNFHCESRLFLPIIHLGAFLYVNFLCVCSVKVK